MQNNLEPKVADAVEWILYKMKLRSKVHISKVKNPDIMNQALAHIYKTNADRMIGRIVYRNDEYFWKDKCVIMDKNAGTLHIKFGTKKKQLSQVRTISKELNV